MHEQFKGRSGKNANLLPLTLRCEGLAMPQVWVFRYRHRKDLRIQDTQRCRGAGADESGIDELRQEVDGIIKFEC